MVSITSNIAVTSSSYSLSTLAMVNPTYVNKSTLKDYNTITIKVGGKDGQQQRDVHFPSRHFRLQCFLLLSLQLALTLEPVWA